MSLIPDRLQAEVLASGAGDAAVKLWSFSRRRCMVTLHGDLPSLHGELLRFLFHASAKVLAYARSHKPISLSVRVRAFAHLRGMLKLCCSHPMMNQPKPAVTSLGGQGTARACAAWRSMQAASSSPAPPWTAQRASGMLPAVLVSRRCGALPSPDPNP